MKSAYELAMERLEKDNPSGPTLTDEQRQELAEIGSKYESKIAEARILAESKLKKATHMGEVQEIEASLQTDIRRLEAERDEKKNEVRQRAEQS